MAWIARNKNNTLVIFNDKPASDGYYISEMNRLDLKTLPILV